MAKKITPSALRAKAKAMLEQATLVEDKLYMKVGRMVAKELNKKDAFTSKNDSDLKAEIGNLKEKTNQILEG